MMNGRFLLDDRRSFVVEVVMKGNARIRPFAWRFVVLSAVLSDAVHGPNFATTVQ